MRFVSDVRISITMLSFKRDERYTTLPPMNKGSGTRSGGNLMQNCLGDNIPNIIEDPT